MSTVTRSIRKDSGRKVEVPTTVALADPAFCPKCLTRRVPRIEARAETYPVRGQAITVDAAIAVCPECGEELDSHLEEENLARAYDEYRRLFKIVAPADIRQLRGTYDLSQRGLARLLGWGPITVHRYETGAVPDSVHNDLLLALQDPATMRKFLTAHGDRLSAREWRRVNAAPDQQQQRHGVTFSWVLQEMIEQRPASERGHRAFDLERLGQMAAYFASRARVTSTKLLKLLFYADFLSFKRRTVSMSGTAYIHLRYGPVPEYHEYILPQLVSDGALKPEEAFYNTKEGGVETVDYGAAVDFDPGMFTAEELDILREVCDQLGQLRAKDIVARVHKEAAWNMTGERQLIPYELAIELSLS
jgi:putative zinc finger/helix-turn-helix YgiT family protein